MRSRWTALAVIFLTRLSMGFQLQSIASIAPFLIDEFRLSYAQLGWLLGLYLLPGAAIALPGGLLGRRFGDRRVVVVGLALMGYLGMAVTQPLAGLIRDRSGSPAAPVFFAAALMAATVLGLGAFRLVQRRGPASAGE